MCGQRVWGSCPALNPLKKGRQHLPAPPTQRRSAKSSQAPAEARKGFAGSRRALASEERSQLWRGAPGPSVCGLCPITPAPPTGNPLGSSLIRPTSLFNKKYMNK